MAKKADKKKQWGGLILAIIMIAAIVLLTMPCITSEDNGTPPTTTTTTTGTGTTTAITTTHPTTTEDLCGYDYLYDFPCICMDNETATSYYQNYVAWLELNTLHCLDADAEWKTCDDPTTQEFEWCWWKMETCAEQGAPDCLCMGFMEADAIWGASAINHWCENTYTLCGMDEFNMWMFCYDTNYPANITLPALIGEDSTVTSYNPAATPATGFIVLAALLGVVVCMLSRKKKM